jgi:hypothetical protein
MAKKPKKIESDGAGVSIGFLLSLLVGFYLIGHIINVGH